MPPKVIFLIRHAEKPDAVDGTSYTGIDVTGSPNPHCLIPRGWQRAGALATLFGSGKPGDGGYSGTTRTDLAVPDRLYSPEYGNSAKTINHRTYETVLPLSQRLGLTIDTAYPEGREGKLAASIVGNDSGVSLVAWEHDHIPDIAAHIPAVPGAAVPTVWPDDRYDLIWCFTLAGGDGVAYEFTAIPQLLLSGDGPV